VTAQIEMRVFAGDAGGAGVSATVGLRCPLALAAAAAAGSVVDGRRPAASASWCVTPKFLQRTQQRRLTETCAG
jgi:hypothetical protein